MPPVILRTVSALVLMPLVLAATYAGGIWFCAMAVTVVAVGGYEWCRMCRALDVPNIRTLWTIVGVLYLAGALSAILWLRLPAETGHMVVFWLFAVVWSADTGAYFAGTLIGGPKLVPRISPHKTWAGLLGGVCLASVVSLIAHAGFSAGASAMVMMALGAGLGLFSQAGDLLESCAKRKCGVKDTGAIIPGHGGVLDRIDGLVAGAVGLALVRVVCPEFAGLW